MKNQLLTGTCLVTLALYSSQPSMAQAPPAPSAGTIHALDPADAFDSLYSTKNLAKGVNNRQALIHSLLTAQFSRLQPPSTATAFASYVSNDPLFSMLQANPNLDPNVVIVLMLNHLALDMTSIDHTTNGKKTAATNNSEPFDDFEATYGEQFGPPRSSRALAMVHLAMFEAANTIDHRYNSYVAPGTTTSIESMILASLAAAPSTATASSAAAMVKAAHDTLIALYPAKSELITVGTLKLTALVSAFENGTDPDDALAKLSVGHQVGAAAAAVVLATRKDDHSDIISNPANCVPHADGATLPAPICWEAYFPANMAPPTNPLDWTVDPISKNPLQLGATWSQVKPFVLKRQDHAHEDHVEFVTTSGLLLGGSTTPVPIPTATQPSFLDSLNKAAYGAMMPDPHGGPNPISSQYGVRIYGDKDGSTATGTNPPNGRTPDQTKYAQIWGYDATALLCAPPRLYNQIATAFYMNHIKADSSQHLAVDSTRYLALINLAMADAGIAAWDAKYTYHIARPVTYIRSQPPQPGDTGWTPLGQVGSNGLADFTTPAFPAYPSGHAVFGGAVFQMMSKALKVDKNTGGPLDFVSDEYDGQTFGADGKIREYLPLHYISLRAAEWENAESRIFLGIHWQRDADDGTALGNEIADAVFSRVLQPIAID